MVLSSHGAALLGHAPRKLWTGLIGLNYSRRQRLGIKPSEHVIQSLIGEGWLGGLVEKDGPASLGFALGVHVLSPDCMGFLALRDIGSAH
jgi:hypothetical protein